MEKEFVTYEQALALKELGFDEKCLTYYYNEILVFTPIPSLNTNSFWVGKDNNFITVPLKQQAFRWFREKYNIAHEINVYSTTDGYAFSFKILCKKYTPFIDANDTWTTYEEAENACVDKLISIAQEHGKD
jgi:hypothetical protein